MANISEESREARRRLLGNVVRKRLMRKCSNENMELSGNLKKKIEKCNTKNQDRVQQEEEAQFGEGKHDYKREKVEDISHG